MTSWKNARTLYTLPGVLYHPGAPLWIAGGELLAGAEELQACRLRLQVIEDCRVKSATVAIRALDAGGAPLGLEIPYRYTGLKAGRDECFGEKSPIVLPLDGAASFTVRVLRVDFETGESWLCGEDWQPLPAPVMLEERCGAPELAEQFRIRYGGDCRFAISPMEDLWLCTCGAANREREASCHHCHRIRAALENVNTEALRGESERRAKKELVREQESRKDRRSLLKKGLLAAAVLVPLLTLVIGLLIAVPREVERKNSYESAQRLALLGEFDTAREIYASLGDYRDSEEMAGRGLDYLRARELMLRAEGNDPSALQSIGYTRADLTEDITPAILLYTAAQEEFEALGDYRDSAALAAACAAGLEESRAAVLRAAYDRAGALLEKGALSAAREAYLALGDTELAAEPAYRKVSALTDFIRRYNIRGIFASLSMDPAGRTIFSLPKDTALTLGSQSVADLMASCGEDPVDLLLEDAPGPGLLPLDEAVKALIASLDGYKDSEGLLAAIAEATDYTREFFTLCESGDIYGAYDWLTSYDGAFEDREAWLSDLELYMPYCADWDLYLGDSTVIPLTAERNEKCMSFHSRVLLRDGVATLRLSPPDGSYSVDLYADQGADRFFNDEFENAHYLVVITNAGHLSYLKYNLQGKLASSCEYEPAD